MKIDKPRGDVIGEFFLSIKIVVETFLEIDVSDLLVLTQRLQDPLYMEV
jgi:hypothetical protein